MSKYNEEYYIVDEAYDENTLYLTALQKTANRDYEFTKMEVGGEPLFFENAYKEKDMKEGKSRPLLDAHMNMNFLLVNSEVRNNLKHYDIKGCHLYPSVIIDDVGEYHDDFWLFNIYQNADFLNLKECKIDDYDEDEEEHDIEKYSLDENLLDTIPEERRLVFRPLRSNMGHTIVHQTVVDVFSNLGIDNIKFYKLSEWEDGMQFRS